MSWANPQFSDATMSTPRSSLIPAQILISVSFLCAALMLLASSPRAESPLSPAYSEIHVRRLLPDGSEPEQLRDLEAEFVRSLIEQASDQGVDISDMVAIAQELEPYYPDLITSPDGPQDPIYYYKWDDELGWVRVCEIPDTLILDGPLILNPIVVSVSNGIVLS